MAERGSAAPPPVRALLVGNDFLPGLGGIQEYVHALASHLDGAGVVAGAHPDADDEALGYPVWRAQRRIMLPTTATVRLVDDAVRAHGADVVMITAPFPLAAIGARLDVPFVVVCHGAEVVVPASLPGARGAYRRWLRRATCLFAVSRYTAARVRSLVGPDGPPIRLAPPGIDLERFRPATPAAVASMRARLGVGDAPLVVSVGRLVPRKGMTTLVRALPRLRSAVPDLRLVLAGSGRLERRLRRLASRVDGDAVLLTGRMASADLPALYSAARVAAMPVRRRWGGLEQEGFGIVFVEAQACGVPVVAGRSGGAPETVRDGVTGLVVDGSSLDEVADAVAALLTDPERRRAMGAAAREHAATFASSEVAARVARDLAAIAAGERIDSQM